MQTERPKKDIRLPKKEIWIMNLFLCSRFCNVGTLIKENLQNKRITCIPTAAAKEGASRYVLAGRELLSEMGAIVTEMDISKEDRNTIKAALLSFYSVRTHRTFCHLHYLSILSIIHLEPPVCCGYYHLLGCNLSLPRGSFYFNSQFLRITGMLT